MGQKRYKTNAGLVVVALERDYVSFRAVNDPIDVLLYFTLQHECDFHIDMHQIKINPKVF